MQLTFSLSGYFDRGKQVDLAAVVYVPDTSLLVDPIPDLVNQSGDGVVTDPETLATYGTPVTGVAADSAARVVFRIPASFVGEDFTVQLLDDQGNPSSSPQADGILATVQGVASGSQMQATAVQTSLGPMAFCLYFPPQNFSRGGDDDAAVRRYVTLQATSMNNQDDVVVTDVTILRPPVVLVHGLWDGPEGWDYFAPLINDPSMRFFVRRVNYDQPPQGSISDSIPGYSAEILSSASGNALGFAYNTPLVFKQIGDFINSFREENHAAAVQADVVAHSMGGTITRTLENLPQFPGTKAFNVGNIHKLITIGTPHLGTPVATDLIKTENTCMRNLLAKNQKLAFYTVTIGSATHSGAVGDLQGDGWGSNLSPALQSIGSANGHEVPTALISGIMTQQNLNGLNSLYPAGLIRLMCSNEPLAPQLTPQGWPAYFGQDSDGIVPARVNSIICSAARSPMSFTPPERKNLASMALASWIRIHRQRFRQPSSSFSISP